MDKPQATLVGYNSSVIINTQNQWFTHMIWLLYNVNQIGWSYQNFKAWLLLFLKFEVILIKKKQVSKYSTDRKMILAIDWKWRNKSTNIGFFERNGEILNFKRTDTITVERPFFKEIVIKNYEILCQNIHW